MKNSAKYEKKIKRLVSRKPSSQPDVPTDRIALLVKGVLSENTTLAKASWAMTILADEFVDFNELRIAPLRDIIEVLGEDFPRVREKAHSITAALQAIFNRTNSLSVDFLTKMTKRETRSLLREKAGLSRWSESIVTLYGFGGHAIPVDDLLLEALKTDGYIHPESNLSDLQGFLERITPGKDAISRHESLQEYSAKMAPKITREWARQQKLAEAKAKAKALAKAKAQAKAEAKAKAKAEAKAQAEAKAKTEVKAKAKAKAKKAKAKVKAKAKPKSATKKKTKSTAKKKVKSATKTVAKKAVKKKTKKKTAAKTTAKKKKKTSPRRKKK